MRTASGHARVGCTFNEQSTTREHGFGHKFITFTRFPVIRLIACLVNRACHRRPLPCSGANPATCHFTCIERIVSRYVSPRIHLPRSSKPSVERSRRSHDAHRSSEKPVNEGVAMTVRRRLRRQPPNTTSGLHPATSSPTEGPKTTTVHRRGSPATTLARPPRPQPRRPALPAHRAPRERCSRRRACRRRGPRSHSRPRASSPR